MKKYAIMTIAILAMMALSTPLYASGDMDKSSKKQHDTATMGDHSKDMDRVGTVPTAEELRGMEVYSQQGEEIGNIEEVAMDDQSGKINFVTLSKGGILGIGDKEIPLPLEALTFEGDRATLTVDTSKLENVPDQANVSNEQFQRDLQSHYGVSPAWKQDSGMDKEKSSMKENMEDDSTKPDLKSESILDDSDKKKSDY